MSLWSWRCSISLRLTRHDVCLSLKYLASVYLPQQRSSSWCFICSSLRSALIPLLQLQASSPVCFKPLVVPDGWGLNQAVSFVSPVAENDSKSDFDCFQMLFKSGDMSSAALCSKHHPSVALNKCQGFGTDRDLLCNDCVLTLKLFFTSSLCLAQRAMEGWTRGWRWRPLARRDWRSCWRCPPSPKVQGLNQSYADPRGRCFYTLEWESAPRRPSVRWSQATRRTTSSEVQFVLVWRQ